MKKLTTIMRFTEMVAVILGMMMIVNEVKSMCNYTVALAESQSEEETAAKIEDYDEIEYEPQPDFVQNDLYVQSSQDYPQEEVMSSESNVVIAGNYRAAILLGSNGSTIKIREGCDEKNIALAGVNALSGTEWSTFTDDAIRRLVIPNIGKLVFLMEDTTGSGYYVYFTEDIQNINNMLNYNLLSNGYSLVSSCSLYDEFVKAQDVAKTNKLGLFGIEEFRAYW